jgi:hypothetical protein
MDDLVRRFRRTHDLEIRKEIEELNAFGWRPASTQVKSATWPIGRNDNAKLISRNSLGAKFYARHSASPDLSSNRH